jgi:hypothetical protein
VRDDRVMTQETAAVGAITDSATIRKLRACTRCGSITKATTAKRAWAMFAASGALFALYVADASAAPTGAQDSLVTRMAAAALLLIAVFHPGVCRACQSRRIVPLDTPEGRRIRGLNGV